MPEAELVPPMPTSAARPTRCRRWAARRGSSGRPGRRRGRRCRPGRRAVVALVDRDRRRRPGPGGRRCEPEQAAADDADAGRVMRSLASASPPGARSGACRRPSSAGCALALADAARGVEVDGDLGDAGVHARRACRGSRPCRRSRLTHEGIAVVVVHARSIACAVDAEERGDGAGVDAGGHATAVAAAAMSTRGCPRDHRRRRRAPTRDESAPPRPRPAWSRGVEVAGGVGLQRDDEDASSSRLERPLEAGVGTPRRPWLLDLDAASTGSGAGVARRDSGGGVGGAVVDESQRPPGRRASGRCFEVGRGAGSCPLPR